MQIFLKIFSRLRIFYLAVCGKIIWLFVEISIGNLRIYGNPIRQRAHLSQQVQKIRKFSSIFLAGRWERRRRRILGKLPQICDKRER